jgi:hypothetical protein
MRDFLRSTPRRTFVLYPLALWALEAAVQRRLPRLDPRGAPLMAWGYLQYRLGGRYRGARGGGGPGLEVAPHTLVTTGPYAYTRNPMYLGHLIFLAGLAVTLHSPRAALLAAAVAMWFDRRVRGDEARLLAQFGEAYAAYRRRVPRWVPDVRLQVRRRADASGRADR